MDWRGVRKYLQLQNQDNNAFIREFLEIQAMLQL